MAADVAALLPPRFVSTLAEMAPDGRRRMLVKLRVALAASRAAKAGLDPSDAARRELADANTALKELGLPTV